MKAYLANLNVRERRLVIAAAVMLALLLAYLLVFRPLVGNLQRMEQQVETQRLDLRWMQASAAEVQQLRGSANGRASVGGQSLLGVIEATARRGKMAPAIKKIQPEGQNGARVWLENAPFDDLALWLDQISESHGVAIGDITVERVSQPGLVNARVLLEARG